MTLPHSRARKRAFLGAAFAAVLPLSTAATFAQTGPFAGMSGAWAGGGTISMNDGTSERLRCRARYSTSPSGANLHQELRCASDSYRFDVSSNVVYEGGAISGTWTETSRNASGHVSGSANGGSLQVSVDGSGFTAEMAVETRGSRQSVSIRPRGTDIRAVSITLTRG